ncbi:hypothetical protein [Ornithinimicrobium sp. LYQ103]|uniref:hypothetical protein n=1 Tax=Ornithinimicrobium sp. LYQ103 TaxID=3378796 RepID=UPI003852C242
MDGTDGLFYIDGDDNLTTMVVTPHEAEDVLQALLSRHPDLLAGGQMDPHSPRRWLLVAREHGVPDREEASHDRWSLDHLFVDQDAVPTLVEVKRSTDTRIRREVVGQMLDYAANGILYWPVDRLREAFSSTQRAAGQDPDEAVRKLTGDEDDVESFFDRVHENLQAGRVRLVFVADAVPDELQRIVEFLNTQMSPAEVFAVEVKQYASPGFVGRTIVPRVIGRTASSMNKQGSSKAPLTAQEYREQADPETLELADRFAAWAMENDLQVVETRQARTVWRPGRSVVARLYYGGTLVFDMVTVRKRQGDTRTDELMARLQALTTRQLSGRWPAVPADDALGDWPSTLGILKDVR